MALNLQISRLKLKVHPLRYTSHAFDIGVAKVALPIVNYIVCHIGAMLTFRSVLAPSAGCFSHHI